MLYNIFSLKSVFRFPGKRYKFEWRTCERRTNLCDFGESSKPRIWGSNKGVQFKLHFNAYNIYIDWLSSFYLQFLKDEIGEPGGKEDCWSSYSRIPYRVPGIASWCPWPNSFKVPECSQGIFCLSCCYFNSCSFLEMLLLTPQPPNPPQLLGSFSGKESQRISETKECPEIIIPSWKACWLFSYWSRRSWYDDFLFVMNYPRKADESVYKVYWYNM